jgi:hypothetical protein
MPLASTRRAVDGFVVQPSVPPAGDFETGKTLAVFAGRVVDLVAGMGALFAEGDYHEKRLASLAAESDFCCSARAGT